MRSLVSMFVFFAATILGGCMAKNQPSEGAALPPDQLGVVDPDPETDPAGVAPPCNPTGKTGAELTKCYEQNESIYKHFDDEAKSREPWFSFPPDSWADSTEVDPKQIAPVLPQAMAQAVQKLQAKPSVEITPAEAAQLTGKPSVPAGLKPILVRGLYYFAETGNFAIYQKGGAILVQHDSTGHTTPKETRAGIVVFLPEMPRQVFVDCSVTE